MHAITYEAYGPPTRLSLQEIEPPAIGDHDVLVRVHAASLNSWDRDNLLGTLPTRAMLGFRKPKVRVIGGDIAGRVAKVGSAVTRWKPGDEVLCDLCESGWGAFAEYARVPQQVLVKKPAALSLAAAAALPQAGVMALQGIRDHGRLQKGQRVLINGAGGGVGSYALQLAKMYGAEVTGVDSEAKLAWMSTLGADHVIDYRAQDYTRAEQRYDFILDCELHRSPLDCRRVLAPQGRLTVVGGALPRIFQTFALGRLFDPALEVLVHKPNKNLAEIAELVASGSIRAPIEREYALSETPLAMERLCAGEVLGKAVIVME